MDRRLSPAHLDVVAVEGDVDRAEPDLLAAELGDQPAQALRERDASRMDADERDPVESVFASTISWAIRVRLRWIASPSSRIFSEETPAWLNGSAP